MVKELVQHPLFKGLSTRTIQRVLLPYYIEQMGRENLSAQAMIEFFEFEGFAIYVLDHLDSLDEAAGKELLKADTNFIKALDSYAAKYNLVPEDKDLEAGETKFDYLYEITLKDLDRESRRETINELIDIYNDILGSDEVFEEVEDLDDDSFNKLTENYLTEVYSNVKSFKATSCDLTDNKLVIEGVITFKSGKSKTTTFVYEAKKAANKKVILEGLNADFATEKAFKLSCKLDTANCLIVEKLNYKYSINETLVEGLLK